MINEKILASSFKNVDIFSTEDIAILFVSKDNKSITFNICSNADRADGYIPKSIILTEMPKENFKIIARIISDIDFPLNFDVKDSNRVIANSLEDKLKTDLILKEIIELL